MAFGPSFPLAMLAGADSQEATPVSTLALWKWESAPLQIPELSSGPTASIGFASGGIAFPFDFAGLRLKSLVIPNLDCILRADVSSTDAFRKAKTPQSRDSPLEHDWRPESVDFAFVEDMHIGADELSEFTYSRQFCWIIA